MPSLRVLDLSENSGISGDIPACLLQSSLLSLGLAATGLGGTLPVMPTIRHFIAGSNQLGGSMPDYVASNSAQDQLLTLDIRQNGYG